MTELTDDDIHELIERAYPFGETRWGNEEQNAAHDRIAAALRLLVAVEECERRGWGFHCGSGCSTIFADGQAVVAVRDTLTAAVEAAIAATGKP